MVRRVSIVAWALWSTACGPAPGYEPEAPPAGRPELAMKGEAVVDAPATTAAAEEPACDRARRWADEGKSLASEGWVTRADRLLARAAAACPDAGDPSLRQALAGAMKPGDRAALEQRLVGATDPEVVRRTSASWLSAATTELGASPRLVERPEGHLVGMSDDGSVLVLAANHGRSVQRSTITVVDGTTGRATHIIEPKSYVSHAAVHGDLLLLVERGRLRLWSLSKNAPVRELAWTGEAYSWAGFHDGGKQVVAVGSHRFDGVVRLYDVVTGDSPRELKAPKQQLMQVRVARAGDALVVGRRREVLVVDLAAGKVTRQLTTVSQDRDKRLVEVEDVAVRADGTLAALHDNGMLMVFDPTGTAPSQTIETKRRGGSLAFLRDGRRLLLATRAGFDGELQTIDLGTGAAVRSRPIGGDGAVLTADGTKVLVSSRRAPPRFETTAGDPLWPDPVVGWPIGAVAMSRGLVVARERHGQDGTTVQLWGWYRDQHRHIERPGYRSEVIAISPSGRQAAAMFARKGAVWSLSDGVVQPFAGPDGRGFPDTLTFAGEGALWAMFERPATIHRATLPVGAWQQQGDPLPGDGFSKTVLSPHGEGATRDSGVVMLHDGTKLADGDAGGLAYSGDGERLFVGSEKRLAWYDRAGALVDELALPCRPSDVAPDERGERVAFRCDRQLMVVRLPDQLIEQPEEEHYVSVESVVTSPSGHLVAQHEDTRVRFYATDDLSLRATLTLPRGTALVTAADGRLSRPLPAPWRDRVACVIGHRAFPYAWCEDGLVDDALVEALLLPPNPG